MMTTQIPRPAPCPMWRLGVVLQGRQLVVEELLELLLERDGHGRAPGRHGCGHRLDVRRPDVKHRDVGARRARRRPHRGRAAPPLRTWTWTRGQRLDVATVDGLGPVERGQRPDGDRLDVGAGVGHLCRGSGSPGSGTAIDLASYRRTQPDAGLRKQLLVRDLGERVGRGGRRGPSRLRLNPRMDVLATRENALSSAERREAAALYRVQERTGTDWAVGRAVVPRLNLRLAPHLRRHRARDHLDELGEQGGRICRGRGHGFSAGRGPEGGRTGGRDRTMFDRSGRP